MAIKKKTTIAEAGSLGGFSGADLVASSSASGWEMFKESMPKKISTADFYMNKKKNSPKASRQLEGAGSYDFAYNKVDTTSVKTELAGEEDSLMGRLAKRMASRDYIDKQNLGMGTKAQKATIADATSSKILEQADCGKEFGIFKSKMKDIQTADNYQSYNNNSQSAITADDTMQEFMRQAPGKMVLGNSVLEDLKTGTKIEHEHKDTVNKIKAGKIKKNEDAYKAIATDHLKEHCDYYDKNKGLPEMERRLSNETASMVDNTLMEDLFNDKQKNEQESITPYWDKIERIKGRELDASGINAKLRKRANATPGAPAGDYTNSKTEMVMPGATMADQAKATNRTIGYGLENMKL